MWPRKYLRRITTSSAISGLAELFCTFYCRVTHHFEDVATKKYSPTLLGLLSVSTVNSSLTVDKVWNNISKEAKALVKLMLDRNVGRRITAEDALNYPWIQQCTRIEPIGEEALLNMEQFFVSQPANLV